MTPTTPGERPISLNRAHTHILFMVCICKQNTRNLALEDDTIQENFFAMIETNILYLCCSVWTHVAVGHLKSDWYSQGTESKIFFFLHFSYI